MTRLLVIANEPPWPAHNGGRARMSGLITALAAGHDVVVACAVSAGGAEQPPVRVVPLPLSRRGRVAAVLGAAPRLGAGLLDEGAAGPLRGLVTEHAAEAMLVTHSYLLPLVPDLGLPLVLDLPNLEVARTASAARSGPAPRRAVAALEHAKARRWEPAAVRRADVCLAVDEADAATARGWGAREVLVVPNASDAVPMPPSPAAGFALAVADWRYDANSDALPHLLEHVWPKVRAQLPQAELVLVGRGAPKELPAGVTAAGFVEDLRRYYDQAAVAVAPATSGAGTQVKVADAVAHGRVVVCPPYGAPSVPLHAQEACVVTDDLAGALVQLLRDAPERHRRERLLSAAAPSWSEAAQPLERWLAAAVSRA